jgi:uncharacterized membrane protein
VEWDAVITTYIPNEVLVGRPTPERRSARGDYPLYPNPDGTTTVDVKLSYNPVAGALGHVVASLFGADPETEMNQDLLRMKTFIETGKRPHDAAQSRGQVNPGSTVEPFRRPDE